MDHSHPAEVLAIPRNESKLAKVSTPVEHIGLLRRYYRPEVERLRDMVPGLDLSLWPHFDDLA